MNFLTTVDQAFEFYKRCQEQGAETLEERIKIAEQMARERLVFKQTDAQLLKRLKGKKVLEVKSQCKPPKSA